MSSGRVAVVLALALSLVPSAAAARAGTAQGAIGPDALPVAAPNSLDLGAALSSDGTFRGAPGLAGSVDPAGWTLVSDLASGQPPRFAAASASSSAPFPSSKWYAIDAGANGALNQTVTAVVVSGTDLYVAGNFTGAAGLAQADGVAKWNGSSWSALAPVAGTISALAVLNSNLYIGGTFSDLGGDAKADNVARWNGSGWSALGDNVNGAGGGTNGALGGAVLALAVSGTNLYVGGNFQNAANVLQADYVAEWNGTAWSALGSGVNPNNGALTGTVHALAVSGTDVYVGGNFGNLAVPGGQFIAKWNGTAWSAMRNANSTGVEQAVWAIAVSGNDVYIGGDFTDAGVEPKADYVAHWNGTSWSALGDNVNGAAGGNNGALGNGSHVRTLAISGSTVFVGGQFNNAASLQEADNVASWNSGTNVWSALGDNQNGGGFDGAVLTAVNALGLLGGNLYMGGTAINVAGVPQADFVAMWNGTIWSALGDDRYGNGATNSAINGVVTIRAMAVSGSHIYIGGAFTDAVGMARADYIVEWNGTNWAALGDVNNNGTGTDGALNGYVNALAVSGTDLYVGGGFQNAGSVSQADYVAKWNGSAWAALGDINNDGSGADGALNYNVFALAVSGANLYVGGGFSNAASIQKADDLAKWNGSTWSALGDDKNNDGTGTNGAFNSWVEALALSGSDVYAAGTFSNAAGLAKADRVARWNSGTNTWTALGDDKNNDGTGTNGAVQYQVNAVAVLGADVYIGGIFVNVAGVPTADKIARWSSASNKWSAVGDSKNDGTGADGPLNSDAYALAVVGNELYVGGDFTDAAGLPKGDYLAKWNGSAWSTVGDNLNDGSGLNGALTYDVLTLTASATDVYVGGIFTDTAGLPKADYVARWVLPVAAPPAAKPDGRIRKGRGAYVGNNIYNTTGLNQTKSGSKTPGNTVKFGISIQNDRTVSDSFKLSATGTTVAGYTITYFRGTTNITSAVVAGTYATPVLAAGASLLITVKVKVTSTAAVGSSVTRLATITSVSDGTKQDAVKLIVSRT